MNENGKYVYVLSSDETDVYLQQLAVSAFTLRQHNPFNPIILVCDPITYSTFCGNRSGIKFLVDNILTIETPEWTKNNKMLTSRWLKTNLRKLLSGPYLFIDTDTIILSDLSEIWNKDIALGSVKDAGISREWNSGVMKVEDTPETRLFYEKWTEYWEKNAKDGFPTDQQSLLKVSEEYPGMMKVLDNKWNYQVFWGKTPPEDTKILHYYNAGMDKNDKGAKNIFSNVDLLSLDNLSVQRIIFQILTLRLTTSSNHANTWQTTNCGFLYSQAPRLFGKFDSLAGIIYKIRKLL